jgi:hypothetical protein
MANGPNSGATHMSGKASKMLAEWGSTLILLPLLWYSVFLISAESALLIWLLLLAGYIPLLLYANKKIEFGSTTLSGKAEYIRRFTLVLGKVELGFLLFVVYSFVYILIFRKDDFFAR